MADVMLAALGELDPATRDLLDDAAGRLIAAWADAPPEPELAAFLPDCSPRVRVRMLVELIKEDREARKDRGLPPKSFDAYAAQWLELSDCPGARQEIENSSTSLWGLASRRSRWPAPGESFGAYRILDLVSSDGGMGVVFRAERIQAVLDDQLAIKIPKHEFSARKDLLDQFITEARAAHQLHHEHICPVYDAGEVDGTYYICMPLVDGDSLSRRAADRPLSARDAAALVEKVCRALAKAHAAGIVHRDVKPSNIMVRRGDGEPLLMDFGLALVRPYGALAVDPLPQCAAQTPDVHADATVWMSHAGSLRSYSDATTAGCIVGTLPYMSPEQVRGEPVDHRTDVYSLGVVLYELLTGRQPFRRQNTGDLPEWFIELRRWTYTICHVAPPRPSKLAPTVPRALDAVCLKAIAKNREDRYQTADAFGAALRQCLAPRRSRWRRLTAHALLLAAGVLLAALVFAKTGDGMVQVDSLEPDAECEIDGLAIPLGAGHVETPLAVGRHTATIRKGGKAKDKIPIRIRWRGSRARVEIPLYVDLAKAESIDTGPGIVSLRPSKDGAAVLAAYKAAANQRDVPARLVLFDLATRKPAASFTFPPVDDEFIRYDPGQVVLSPRDKRTAYAANYQRWDISQVDLEAKTLVRDIPIGAKPLGRWSRGLAITSDGRRMLVTFGSDERPGPSDNDGCQIVDLADANNPRAIESSRMAMEGETASGLLAMAADGKHAYVVTNATPGKSAHLYEITMDSSREPRSRRLSGGRFAGLALSPKGDRAYIADAQRREIHVVDLGSLQPAATFPLPNYVPGLLAASPDGALVAILVREMRAVLLVDAQSGQLLGRAEGLGEGPSDMAFTPDGERLLIAQISERMGISVLRLAPFRGGIVFSGRNIQGNANPQLFTMSSDGKSILRLSENHAVDCCPRWSPDGRRIAFLSDRDGRPGLFVCTRTGEVVRQFKQADPFMGGPPDMAPLDWSPDGRRIAFINSDQTALRIIEAESGQIETVLAGEVPVQGDAQRLRGLSMHFCVAWNKADGSIVLGSRKPESAYTQDFFRLDPGKRPVQAQPLTANKGEDKAWRFAGLSPSPDGSRLAALRYPNGPGLTPQALYLLKADGSGAKPIAGSETTVNAMPRWSSDGRTLVYPGRQAEETRRQLFLLNAAGGKPRPLTETNQDVSDADLWGVVP